ncbi:hypothetical protein MASR1M90_23890 [Desulfovibrionales bacterium]
MKQQQKAQACGRKPGQRKYGKAGAIPWAKYKGFMRETKAFLYVKCFTACQFGQVIALVLLIIAGAVVAWGWLS